MGESAAPEIIQINSPMTPGRHFANLRVRGGLSQMPWRYNSRIKKGKGGEQLPTCQTRWHKNVKAKTSKIIKVFPLQLSPRKQQQQQQHCAFHDRRAPNTKSPQSKLRKETYRSVGVTMKSVTANIQRPNRRREGE